MPKTSVIFIYISIDSLIDGLIFPALSRATMLLIVFSSFFFRIVSACFVLLLLSSIRLYLIKLNIERGGGGGFRY